MIKKILIFLLFSSVCYADTLTIPTTYAPTGQVTSTNLNGNFSAITAIVNGGLDNDNANTTDGYRFYRTVAALPAAGSQGAVYFLTTDNTLNFDNGSAFIKSVAITGTPTSGQAPVYNGSAWVPTTTISSGMILMWSGSIASIPTGWVLCDGTNGTPDLRDRFVMGAGSTYAVAATGGAATINIAHTHTFSATTGTPSGTTNVDGSSSPVGSGTHTHTVSGTTGSTGSATQSVLNPYYALAYIMKS